MKRFALFIALLSALLAGSAARAQGVPFVSAQGNTGSNDWHVGGASGAKWTNNAGAALEARTPGGSLAIVRGGIPVSTADMTTFGFVEPQVLTVVFQPGGTAIGNTFTTWAATYAAAIAATGPVEVFFDGSHTSNAATIPAGSWNFPGPDVTFKGPFNVPVVLVLTFANGATLSGNNFKIQDLDVRTASSSAPIVSLTSGFTYYQFDDSSISGSASAPFFSVTGGGTNLQLTEKNFSNVGDGTNHVVTTGSGATTTMSLAQGSNVFANYNAGAGTYTIFVWDTAAFNGSSVPSTIETVAANLGYDDSLHLPSIGATSAQDAIDYLKAHGGPATGVTAATYGSSSTIPILTIGTDGRITAATTSTVAAPLASTTGTLAISKIAPGSSGQVFMSNATPTATWTTFTGDISVTSTGATQVNSISGPSPITLSNASVVAWSASVGTPEIRQSQQTSNVATSNLLITPQKPFASATGSNGTPGSLLAALSLPVGGGGAEAKLGFTRNGVFEGGIGNYNTSSFDGLWLSTATEPQVLSDGVTLYLGRPDSVITFDTGNNFGTQYGGTGASRGWQFGYPGAADFGGGDNVIGLSPAIVSPTSLTSAGVALSVPAHNVLELEASTFQFPKFSGDVTYKIAPQTTDTATFNTFINGQDAFASATGTHRNAGGVTITGGARATGGVEGAVKIATADNSSEVLAQDGQLQLVSSNPMVLSLSTANFLKTNSISIIGQQAQTTDVTPGDLFFLGDSAWSSAVTNVHGGNVNIFAGLGTTSANGGTAEVGAGDNNTAIVWQPDLISGVSGSSSETIVYDGTGTLNSQVRKIDRRVAFGQTISNGGLLFVTSPLPLATGKSVTIHCHGLARVVTPAGSLSVGDTFEENVDVLVKNVAGTVSQVGTAAVVSRLADAGYGTLSTVGWNNGGTTVGCVLAVLATSGTTAVSDDSLWATFEFN